MINTIRKICFICCVVAISLLIVLPVTLGEEKIDKASESRTIIEIGGVGGYLRGWQGYSVVADGQEISGVHRYGGGVYGGEVSLKRRYKESRFHFGFRSMLVGGYLSHPYDSVGSSLNDEGESSGEVECSYKTYNSGLFATMFVTDFSFLDWLWTEMILGMVISIDSNRELFIGNIVGLGLGVSFFNNCEANLYIRANFTAAIPFRNGIIPNGALGVRF